MKAKNPSLKYVQEIVPDIYWIDGGGSNLFLCVEDEGLSLIDAGMPNRADKVFTLIEKLGFQKQDLKRIVVTHADYDHVGSLAAIQRESGCAVYVSKLTNSYLKRGSFPRHLPRLIQFVVDRFLTYEIVEPKAVKEFEDGDILPVLGGMKAIHSPGHTPDHFAFFNPIVGVLFSGDVLNTRGGDLHTSRDGVSANPRQVIASARTLLNFSPAVIACGHGVPLSNHSADVLMHLYNQLRQKEALL